MNYWFRLGIIIIIYSFIPSLYGKLAGAIFVLVYLLAKKHIRSFLIFVICIALSYLLSNLPITKPPQTFQGKVTLVKENYFLVSYQYQQVWIYSSHSVNFDDQVKITCSLAEIVSPHNRAGFSYAEYAKSINSKYQCKNGSFEIIKNGNTLRNRLYLLVNQLPQENQKLMKMFLFHQYPDDSADIIYLLLASGFHLSFLLNLLRKILQLRLTDKQLKPIITSIVLMFAIIYHFDFLTFRLLLRNLLNYSSENRKNKWGINTIVLFTLFPLKINNLGLLIPVMLGLISLIPGKFKFVGHNLIIILVQLFLNGYMYLSNLVYLIFLRPLFSLIYLLCLIRFWLPIDSLLNKFSWLPESLSSINLPSFGRLIGKPSFLFILLIIFLYSRYQASHHKKTLLLLVVLLFANRYQAYLRPYPLVVTIDVGQGDSALICLPFNRGNILIDTGGLFGSDVAKDITLPVLSSYGIDKLNVVELSHADHDHSGGYDSLKNLVKIDKTITTKTEYFTVNGVKFYDLLFEKEYEDENANCLTAYFDLAGIKFLYTGDITAAVEKELISNHDGLKVDILKLAHHGSKTSNSEKFLQRVQPTLAIISSGKNNNYHHPSSEVLERLKENRIAYLNTAYSGSIEIKLWPIFKIVQTENGQFAIIFKNELFN